RGGHPRVLKAQSWSAPAAFEVVAAVQQCQCLTAAARCGSRVRVWHLKRSRPDRCSAMGGRASLSRARDAEMVMVTDCDVVLRDGSTLRIRSLLAEDETALKRFVDEHSPDSVYFRFFGPRPARDVLERLLHADGRNQCALVAECGDR